jgi:superfamily II DNA or RNA helicase
MQTVISVLKREEDSRKKDLESLMAAAEQVFFDEAHLMASTQDKGNQFVKVAGQFERAYCRWGLTATPFMRDQYDNLLLQGVTGLVSYSITNSELIEEGFLTPAKVIMKTVLGTLPETWEGNRRSNKAQAKYWRKVYDKGITFNPARNKMIVEEIAAGPYPLLVLVKTIEQGKFIRNLHDLAHPTVTEIPVLTGKSSAIARRKVADDMNTGKLPFVIATTIFDEGIDIPQLRKVILASGGKSHVKLLQRAGRGLRIAEGKEEVIIIDFMDKHHALLLKHSKLRQKVWKEQGFEIHVEN